MSRVRIEGSYCGTRVHLDDVVHDGEEYQCPACSYRAGNASMLIAHYFSVQAYHMRKPAEPMKHDAEWYAFADAMHKRLVKGERQYGDGSFQRQPTDLIAEISEEVLDICGWSFVLWCRLQKLAQHVEAPKAAMQPTVLKPV